MNNELVAYFVKDKQGWWAETDKETGIPFYTHPVNPYQSITNTKIEPTVVSYTHPVKELPNNHQYIAQLEMTVRNQQDEIEALKNANRFIQNFAEEQHKRAVALEMRELTDEEILDVWKENSSSGELYYDLLKFARAILRKANK